MEAACVGKYFSCKGSGKLACGKTKEIANLTSCNRYGNTGSKSRYDCIWNEFDKSAHLKDSEQNQNQTRKQCCRSKTCHTKLWIVYDFIDDNRKSTCWSANLAFCSAKGRNTEACYDGSVKSSLRAASRSNRKSNGKWKGNNTHDNTGNKIRHKILCRVLFQ